MDRFVPIGWDLLARKSQSEFLISTSLRTDPIMSIVLGTRDDYVDHHPGLGEIDLLVEVSESSLAWDRGPKLIAYVRANLPIYWIINLIDRQVEVYTDPRPDGNYRNCRIYRPGDQVPVVIAGSERGTVAVTDLLPPGKSI